MRFFIDSSLLPVWFKYPKQFNRMVGQGLINFEPWYILSATEALNRMREISARYPKRDLVPFAKTAASDDVACWQKGFGDKILIIHGYASEGWELRDTYENFWDWLRLAVESTIEFEP